jgi:hypothetical protein
VGNLQRDVVTEDSLQVIKLLHLHQAKMRTYAAWWIQPRQLPTADLTQGKQQHGLQVRGGCRRQGQKKGAKPLTCRRRRSLLRILRRVCIPGLLDNVPLPPACGASQESLPHRWPLRRSTSSATM